MHSLQISRPVEGIANWLRGTIDRLTIVEPRELSCSSKADILNKYTERGGLALHTFLVKKSSALYDPKT